MQGDHCAEVVLTVSDYAVSARGQSVPSSVSSTQKICWFKVSKQPTAKFDFDMCTNKKCELLQARQLQAAAVATMTRGGKQSRQAAAAAGAAGEVFGRPSSALQPPL